MGRVVVSRPGGRPDFDGRRAKRTAIPCRPRLITRLLSYAALCCPAPARAVHSSGALWRLAGGRCALRRAQPCRSPVLYVRTCKQCVLSVSRSSHLQLWPASALTGVVGTEFHTIPPPCRGGRTTTPPAPPRRAALRSWYGVLHALPGVTRPRISPACGPGGTKSTSLLANRPTGRLLRRWRGLPLRGPKS